jgi:hypothetical protein
MKIDNKRVFEIYEANAHLDKQQKAGHLQQRVWHELR